MEWWGSEVTAVTLCCMPMSESIALKSVAIFPSDIKPSTRLGGLYGAKVKTIYIVWKLTKRALAAAKTTIIKQLPIGPSTRMSYALLYYIFPNIVTVKNLYKYWIKCTYCTLWSIVIHNWNWNLPLHVHPVSLQGNGHLYIYQLQQTSNKLWCTMHFKSSFFACTYPLSPTHTDTVCKFDR